MCATSASICAFTALVCLRRFLAARRRIDERERGAAPRPATSVRSMSGSEEPGEDMHDAEEAPLEEEVVPRGSRRGEEGGDDDGERESLKGRRR